MLNRTFSHLPLKKENSVQDHFPTYGYKKGKYCTEHFPIKKQIVYRTFCHSPLTKENYVQYIFPFTVKKGYRYEHI